jgi:hypothetical protein
VQSISELRTTLTKTVSVASQLDRKPGAGRSPGNRTLLTNSRNLDLQALVNQNDAEFAFLAHALDAGSRGMDLCATVKQPEENEFGFLLKPPEKDEIECLLKLNKVDSNGLQRLATPRFEKEANEELVALLGGGDENETLSGGLDRVTSDELLQLLTTAASQHMGKPKKEKSRALPRRPSKKLPTRPMQRVPNAAPPSLPPPRPSSKAGKIAESEKKKKKGRLMAQIGSVFSSEPESGLSQRSRRQSEREREREERGEEERAGPGGVKEDKTRKESKEGSKRLGGFGSTANLITSFTGPSSSALKSSTQGWNSSSSTQLRQPDVPPSPRASNLGQSSDNALGSNSSGFALSGSTSNLTTNNVSAASLTALQSYSNTPKRLSSGTTQRSVSSANTSTLVNSFANLNRPSLPTKRNSLLPLQLGARTASSDRLADEPALPPRHDSLHGMAKDGEQWREKESATTNSNPLATSFATSAFSESGVRARDVPPSPRLAMGMQKGRQSSNLLDNSKLNDKQPDLESSVVSLPPLPQLPSKHSVPPHSMKRSQSVEAVAMHGTPQPLSDQQPNASPARVDRTLHATSGRNSHVSTGERTSGWMKANSTSNLVVCSPDEEIGHADYEQEIEREDKK